MKKKNLSITLFIIGLLALVTGVACLIFNLTKAPATLDGDFLVTVGKWSLEDSEGVVWDFTEVGKGTLTTNDHENDYDFIWAIEGNKLKIETDWLYTLEDEYTYKLDQGAKKLVLTDDEGEYTFVGVAEESEQE